MESSKKKSADICQHVFIIGSKSIGQYGGYETFVERLICEGECNSAIKYHIACKANGEGFMNVKNLVGINITKTNDDGSVKEFEYKNAHAFMIKCPNIGPAVAIYYDRAALNHSIKYCKENNIEHPIFYILTCRVGLFIKSKAKQIKAIGGKYFVNPDGHEWKRAKWPMPVRKYWKWSEAKMVKSADLVICDSVNIEKYIRSEYNIYNTTYIAYGADIEESGLSDDDPLFKKWMKEKNISTQQYYLVVGRFVPENNYETMIREFMISNSKKDFVLITNVNDKFLKELEEKLYFQSDPRIKFVGTVYDRNLLKKIREGAYGYFHGHEVGGTNPSLLEAMASTNLNLLLDVGFNREVGQNAALYWTKEKGNLAALIDKVDEMNRDQREKYGLLAKNIIRESYNWRLISEQYKRVWIE